MDKLDQLASILGVTVISEVSLVPRPLEKGRPVTTKKEKPKMNAQLAQKFADGLAEDAYENHFSSRRGIWHIADIDCLAIYNNHPYGKDASARPRELSRIKKRLAAVGIKTLAMGSGGSTDGGDGQRYTVTLLLDCSVDREDEVVAIAQEETEKTTEELERTTGRPTKIPSPVGNAK